ncbi:16S rRNA (guanine(1207)-N(2))-methyltransferase RsmC [Enterobacteriaceae endosymbiont of Neohaemonia nigricornis]|uniref:16S rRNA (guanine(1207)-N(2))-methyltransferase RsmC n=1 Tax=Enterobacteriaceae endosymbiont of Neohaemonia nigricornis TaxID=2675792 RepID=UPI001449A7A0|nr:16S rRNA (guanine(1207)-N(2))-methyltransferase RsmC [Enterobacteriaceae endosymbiont of Neohaemonia nigricornis]QJC30358.1 16S rRNA (guanine(1207)-N(2))-methyltransferase RsmC [Enterobacteriaceae endosymbiont of Neohaemonia nigricornis]
MYKLLPINQYFLHNFCNKFNNYKVIFAGNITDALPIYLNTFDTIVSTHKYDYYLWLKKILGNKVFFDFANITNINYFNVLIFFWTKNKNESIYLLQQISTLLYNNSDIFIIGANNSGIRSINNISIFNTIFNKIISARKYSIYHTQYKKKHYFHPDSFWKFYYLNEQIIYNLPGVFGDNKLDQGSQLLISTIKSSDIKGKILDLGCGSGVLTSFIAKQSKKIKIYATDIDIKALYSTKKTLFANNIHHGLIFPSHIYSNINEKFNLIISNPPFHNELCYSLHTIYKILYNIKKYLVYNGEFRFVTHNIIPYKKIFKHLSYNFYILSKNNQYTIYSIKNK